MAQCSKHDKALKHYFYLYLYLSPIFLANRHNDIICECWSNTLPYLPNHRIDKITRNFATAPTIRLSGRVVTCPLLSSQLSTRWHHQQLRQIYKLAIAVRRVVEFRCHIPFHLHALRWWQAWAQCLTNKRLWWHFQFIIWKYPWKLVSI